MAEDFLRRWSRLKHEQAAQKPAEKQPLEKTKPRRRPPCRRSTS